MINTSNEYKEKILSSRKFLAKAEITLSDNTVLDVDDSIYSSGIKISDGTSTSGTFQIGSAIINSCTLILDNLDNQYSQYDFTGAVIRPSIGLVLSNTTEWINKGVFTVDTANAVGLTIVITALDNMEKLDTPFYETNMFYPVTAIELLYAMCTYCGVPIATNSFLNDDYIIESAITDATITCREIVAWIAQISGNFARCNVDGALELKWYDFGVFDYAYDPETEIFTDTNKYHRITNIATSPTIATDDVVITGIQAVDTSDSPSTALFGLSGYVIELSDNKLIQTNTQANDIANSVGQKIAGMKFRPLTLSSLSDPSIEAGDIAYVTDSKGNVYQTLITNVSYTIGDYETLTCDAETPSAKSSVRYSAATKSIVEARKAARQEMSTYDLAVQQLNNLVMHSFGVYHTTETLEDGSKIEYSHDKPTLEESLNIWKQTAETFTVSNDGGLTWRGMDADGNIVATVLSAIGVNAEWINVVTSFTVGSKFSVDSTGKVVCNDIDANAGTIAGFDFNIDSTSGGIIHNDNNEQFIRISPFSSMDGAGGYNTNYGAVDLGLASDLMNTLIHLRSDGYARFGLVAENGVSIRFNDFLRDGGTQTLLHTPNFKINLDGSVNIDSDDLATQVTSIAATTNVSGEITNLLVNGDTNIGVTWTNGNVTQIGNTPVTWS